MQVREILAIKGTVLYTIAPKRALADAVAIMSELDIGSLVCFAGGRMSGMLTFREVLKAIHENGKDWANVAVGEAMVCDPIVASPEMQIDELRRLMIDQHMRYLPIMEGTTLMGVISFHDVAKAVLEEQSFENRMLKAYIRDWPAEAKKP